MSHPTPEPQNDVLLVSEGHGAQRSEQLALVVGQTDSVDSIWNSEQIIHIEVGSAFERFPVGQDDTSNKRR